MFLKKKVVKVKNIRKLKFPMFVKQAQNTKNKQKKNK